MILGINTSTLQFSLALVDKIGSVAGELYLDTNKRHFGGLFPSLRFLLGAVEKGVSDISCIAVALGPGSFTGLRVGLSCAKGLTHALEVPMVGISSLEALAAQVPQTSFPITAIIESRRSDVFVAQFRWKTEGTLSRITEDQCLEYGALRSHLALPTLFVGNNYQTQCIKLKESMGEDLILAPPHLWCVRASSIAGLGLRRFASGDTDDPATMVPIYLRPPDIRPNPYCRQEGLTRTL